MADIFEDILRVKRELEATAPPPMHAIKCHPSMYFDVRQAMPTQEWFWTSPPIYTDPRVPVGQVLIAQTREMANVWKMQAQMAYWQYQQDERRRLVTVLRLIADRAA